MTEWARKRCKPCEGGVAPMDADSARGLMRELDPAWELDEERREIRRAFSFKGYYQTLAFVNAVAWIAQRENHHPDLEVGYNRCVVRYKTHVLGGLSENDFICAAKIDRL